MKDAEWTERTCPKCGERLTRYKTRVECDTVRRVFVRCSGELCEYRDHFREIKKATGADALCGSLSAYGLPDSEGVETRRTDEMFAARKDGGTRPIRKG